MSKTRKSSTIGIEQFTIFPFNEERFEYGEPIPLTTLKAIDATFNITTHDEYNDNQLFEVINVFSDVEITCEFTALTPREQGMILGWRRKGAIQLTSNNDIAGAFAIAYKRTKKDGSIKYVKFLNCTARLEGTSGKTSGDSIEVQTDTIIFKAKPMDTNFPLEEYRGAIKLEVDTSDEEYINEGDTWFKAALPLSDDDTDKTPSENIKGESYFIIDEEMKSKNRK